MQIAQGRISNRSLGLSRAPTLSSISWVLRVTGHDHSRQRRCCRTVGLGWTHSRAGVSGSAGLYLIHCSVPRYDGSCICICLLTGVGNNHW
jgi:hypothetical protein